MIRETKYIGIIKTTRSRAIVKHWLNEKKAFSLMHVNCTAWFQKPPSTNMQLKIPVTIYPGASACVFGRTVFLLTPISGGYLTYSSNCPCDTESCDDIHWNFSFADTEDSMKKRQQ